MAEEVGWKCSRSVRVLESSRFGMMIAVSFLFRQVKVESSGGRLVWVVGSK